MMYPSTAALLLSVASQAAALKAGIIGGGLGGLTAANALRKVGIDAQVYERAA